MITLLTGIKELFTLAGAAEKHGRQLTNEDLSVIHDGALLIKGDKILWAGKKSEVKGVLKSLEISAKKVKDINLKAQSVLPAFLDCHNHLVFAGDRQHEFEQRNRGATYQDIAAQGGGIQYTVEQTRKAGEKELLALAEERAQRLLKQGVTTVEVKSGYGLTENDEIKILKVAKKIKSVRTVATYLGAHAIPKDSTAEAYLDEIISSTLPKIKKQNLAQRVDMFVENGYFTADQAKKYYQAANELGFRFTCHADQMTRTGVGAALSRLAPTDSVDHLVQINEQDILTLGNSQATCTLLPTSDFYLKMKYPPARALLDRGARVALATDFNPGTSPTLDISFVGVLARLEMQMSWHEVLAGLTLNAAWALGLQNELGSLEAQKSADFVVLDVPASELFYQVGHHPVREVWSQGRCIHPD